MFLGFCLDASQVAAEMQAWHSQPQRSDTYKHTGDLEPQWDTGPTRRWPGWQRDMITAMSHQPAMANTTSFRA